MIIRCLLHIHTTFLLIYSYKHLHIKPYCSLEINNSVGIQLMEKHPCSNEMGYQACIIDRLFRLYSPQLSVHVNPCSSSGLAMSVLSIRQLNPNWWILHPAWWSGFGWVSLQRLSCFVENSCGSLLWYYQLFAVEEKNLAQNCAGVIAYLVSPHGQSCDGRSIRPSVSVSVCLYPSPSVRQTYHGMCGLPWHIVSSWFMVSSPCWA